MTLDYGPGMIEAADAEGGPSRDDDGAQPLADLVPGLGAQEIDRELRLADRETDVGNRRLAFYLADIWVPLPEDPRRQPAQLGTDAAGRFGLPAVYADRVDLMIRKAGFVPVVGKGIEPRGDAEPSVFVLVPSRHVTAMVVDAAGQRMRALGMMATVAGGLELAGDRNQSGDFDFADLPEGTVAFRAAVGGRLYTQDHDTRQPVAKIVVPVHGSLKVKWEFRLESGNVNDLRVESLEPGGPTLTEFIQNSESKTRGDVTVQMLPGRYAVWLETTPFDSMEVQKIESHSASKRREITLIAGETESVTLDP